MRTLVLSGGGSHGAWQAGAIKALSEKHSYDAVIGTSVGAVNAAGFSTSGADETIDIWKSLNGTSSVMKFNWAWPWNWDGIFHFGPLKEMLTGRLYEKKYSIPTYASVYCLQKSKIETIKLTEDSYYDANIIAGSCAIAGIQSPSIGYLDGGHKEIAPVRFAVETLNSDFIDVVLCDPIKESREDWNPWPIFPIISIMVRALTGMIDEISRTDISEYSERINLYMPSKDIEYSSLSYKKSDIIKMIDIGYKEVSRVGN